MPRAERHRSRDAPIALFVAAEAASVACFAGAMARYPGGAQHAPGARGHSFWLDTLCDLADATARNGAPNGDALLALAGMVALAAALGVMFAIAPRAFRSRSLGARFAPARVVQVSRSPRRELAVAQAGLGTSNGLVAHVPVLS